MWLNWAQEMHSGAMLGLRGDDNSAVGRQNVVPYIKRISSYVAEALRFGIAGWFGERCSLKT